MHFEIEIGTLRIFQYVYVYVRIHTVHATFMKSRIYISICICSVFYFPQHPASLKLTSVEVVMGF